MRTSNYICPHAYDSSLDDIEVTACTIPAEYVKDSNALFQVDDLGALFKGFADATRLRLLKVLEAGAL